MPKGYAGKVLFVDLTSGKINEERPDEKLYRDFIGGCGLGVRFIYERTKPNIDPLGPENMIGFVAGGLAGTGAPISTRYTVCGKSPLTGTWGDANSGGSFGYGLKVAGYDAVFFSGASPKPVYLWIDNGKAELRDASALWGKDTQETEQLIREELGDNKIRVACIGIGGELQTRMACVIHERRAAGRSGLGAVMGSKKLKALAIRGNMKVPVADAEALSELRKKTLKMFTNPTIQSDADCIDGLKKYGTSGFTSDEVIGGGAGVKNWNVIGEEFFPNHANLTGDEVVKYSNRRIACYDCPVGCKGEITLDSGPYAVGKTARPEYETLAHFGPLCLNENLESIIKINDICTRASLDTISAGAVVAFAIECYEKGLLTKEDTGGIELTWGNHEGMVELMEKIAKREGIGELLADGVERAAAKIGKGAEEWAIHVHGEAIPAHDPRITPIWGTDYIVDPTPGRHTRGFPAADPLDIGLGRPWAPYPQLAVPEADFLEYGKKTPAYAVHLAYSEYEWALGLCAFIGDCTGTYPTVEFVAAATGWDFTPDESIKAGRRIKALRQEFNRREGVSMNDFTLPKRVTEPPATGPYKGRYFDHKDVAKLYMEAIGYDPVTGQVTPQTLKELELTELVGSA